MGNRTFTSDKTDAEPLGNPLEGVMFTLDDVIFACEGRIDLLDLSELSMLAVSSTDVRSPEGIAMLSQFLRLAFGPVEYMRLKAHAREYETPPDVLFQIVAEINAAIEGFTEQMTGRPTGPPSSSSPGQPTRADQISQAISLATGEVTFVAPPPPAAPETPETPDAPQAGATTSG